jgi:hypothetical protein
MDNNNQVYRFSWGLIQDCWRNGINPYKSWISWMKKSNIFQNMDSFQENDASDILMG